MGPLKGKKPKGVNEGPWQKFFKDSEEIPEDGPGRR